MPSVLTFNKGEHTLTANTFFCIVKPSLDWSICKKILLLESETKFIERIGNNLQQRMLKRWQDIKELKNVTWEMKDKAWNNYILP